MSPGPAETEAQVRARVLERLRAELGAGLSETGALDALRAARAWRHLRLRALDRELTRHPDALHAPDPHCENALVALLHVLADAGHPVTRPRCARCGRARRELGRVAVEGRCCEWCAGKDQLQQCTRCGRAARARVPRDTEMTATPEMLCRDCDQADPAPPAACRECGEVAELVRRRADATGLCRPCGRRRPVHVCAGCGVSGPASAITEVGAWCSACYRPPQRVCGRCGREVTIHRRASATDPDLCAVCDSRERRHLPRPTQPCAGCGHDEPVQAHLEIGPVCRRCYDAERARTTRCRSCDVVARPYQDRRCARCVLADRVHELLSGPDGVITVKLAPFAQILTGTEEPRSTLAWLRNSPGSAVLAQAVHDDAEVTHDLLDQHPFTPSLHHLRYLLVEAGVLPRRVEHLERLPLWGDRLLEGRPTHHVRLVRPFLHWSLLRRARRRAERGRFTPTSARHIHTAVRVALELLSWLDAQSLDLDGLTQAHLDTWLLAGSGNRRRAHRFLTWTNARGLTAGLVVALPPRDGPTRFYSDDEHRDALQRALHDQGLPLDVRVATVVILLFGVRTHRVAELSTDALSDRDGQRFLSVGGRPVPLPPRVATMLDQLAHQRRLPRRPDAGSDVRADHDHRPIYLFPGRPSSRPITPASLAARLRRHGLRPAAARNTALGALAAELPAPVLADTLGMHINTAIAWSRLAGRDWAEYLADRR